MQILPRPMSPVELFDATACDAAATVMARYSSSFSAATRLLPQRVRTDVRNLYAVVRIADEIVDGAADSGQRALLDAYEQQVLAAHTTRFHTDPILHAFGISARRCGFSQEHLRAFFASMRADVEHRTFDAELLATYVYGSAEVIGLLCLDIFLADSPRDRSVLDPGARALGRAFQHVNFLRDAHEDAHTLGREYYPDLDEAKKEQLVQQIQQDLATAQQCVPELPASAARAVSAAVALYEELTAMIAQRSLQQIRAERVRVPTWKKLVITAKASTASTRSRT